MKKVLSLSLSLCLAFSLFAAVSSAQEITPKDHIAYSVQVDGVSIKLSDNVVGKVSQEELKTIARQAQANGGGDVTIHNVIFASPQTERFTPSAWYDTSVDWSVVKSNITHNNPDPAQLIISVARGASKKLSSSVTKKTTRSVSWSGGVSVPSGASSKLDASVTEEESRTYSKEETWTGPSEGSPYITRNYYFTGFRDYGSFKITGVGWPSGDSYGLYTGTYKEPTHYQEWSQDIK